VEHQSLYQRIQNFYDASSNLWEQIWGEHMHHGFYGAHGKQIKERRQAQIDLIEELIQFAGIGQVDHCLDVGCGIGGSSLYLAEKFACRATGITLSPVQAKRAQERALLAGFDQSTQFQVANALALPFPDQSFDLVWSLESGEHMPDKVQFLQEIDRVLKPGGTLMLATWCHRSTPPFTPNATPLTTEEERHLKAIYEVYHLPFVVALEEYGANADRLQWQNLRTADWSQAVAPFWSAVIQSSFTPQALLGLLQTNGDTIRGAMGLGLMRQGFERGLIRYGVLVGQKP
jgi:tocopherol O-methyltransferase